MIMNQFCSTIKTISTIFDILYFFLIMFICKTIVKIIHFSHIRPLGAAGALAVDICICFHDIESYIFAKSFPSLAV